jgi:hypothetical protein
MADEDKQVFSTQGTAEEVALDFYRRVIEPALEVTYREMNEEDFAVFLSHLIAQLAGSMSLNVGHSVVVGTFKIILERLPDMPERMRRPHKQGGGR